MGNRNSTSFNEVKPEIRLDLGNDYINLVKQQELSRRSQVAYDLANARERFKWITLAYASFGTSIFTGYFKYNKSPGILKGFLVLSSIFYAYEFDLCYGRKLERVNKEYYSIINNEEHWFTIPPLIGNNEIDFYKKVKN